MENFKSSLSAYADYLDEQGCEFIIIAHDVAGQQTRAIYSSNVVPLLAAIFDKSDEAYGIFKEAERMSDHQLPVIGLN